MGKAEGIIRSAFFVLIFALVSTYWSQANDLQTNIIKTGGVLLISFVLTWILCRFIRRRPESG